MVLDTAPPKPDLLSTLKNFHWISSNSVDFHFDLTVIKMNQRNNFLIGMMQESTGLLLENESAQGLKFHIQICLSSPLLFQQKVNILSTLFQASATKILCKLALH